LFRNTLSAVSVSRPYAFRLFADTTGKATRPRTNIPQRANTVKILLRARRFGRRNETNTTRTTQQVHGAGSASRLNPRIFYFSLRFCKLTCVPYSNANRTLLTRCRYTYRDTKRPRRGQNATKTLLAIRSLPIDRPKPPNSRHICPREPPPKADGEYLASPLRVVRDIGF